MENIDLILIQFFIRIEELTGQENALSGAYEDMLERLQENWINKHYLVTYKTKEVAIKNYNLYGIILQITNF